MTAHLRRNESSRKAFETGEAQVVMTNHDHVQKERKSRFLRLLDPSTAIIPIFVFFSVALVGFNLWQSGKSMPQNWWYLICIGMVPVAVSARVAVDSRNSQPHQRLIGAAVVCTILANQFPRAISVALAAIALTLFGISTRSQVGNADNRNQEKLKAVFAGMFLALILLVDNFFVWVVAATYFPSHDGLPQPLQDNGRLLQTMLFESALEVNRRSVQELRSILNVPWALVAASGAALACVELQLVKNRTLWEVTIRALLCLSALRAIRVFSFLLTVLPSQMPDCYRHHFPPPPKDWLSWFMVGLVPNSHGGCNDLIVSGHATVTSVLACLATSVCGSRRFSFALWSLLTIDFLIEVYEGFHYSVDMWLGALLSILLWRILQPLEARSDKTTPVSLLPVSSATKEVLGIYCVPAVFAYMVVIVAPESIANYCIVVGLLVAVCLVWWKGFTSFLQHMMFCLLFITLCVYL